MENQYNVLIDFASAVLVFALMIAGKKQKHGGERAASGLLTILLLCCETVLVTDIAGLLLDGCDFYGAHVLIWIIDSVYWMGQIVYCWLWLLFSDYWSFGSERRLKKRAAVYAIPMAAELAILAVNPLTGWVFYVSGQNVYSRGDYYLLNMIPYVAYIIVSVITVFAGSVTGSENGAKRERLSLVAYMFLPICGVALDALIYGISWVWPMVALSLLMTYLNLQQRYIADEQLVAAKLEAELTESRVAIMLSQIQPHFIFNALSSIQCLCRTDPAVAEKATADFSDFLRGNMDSLTMNKSIGFDKELEHTKHYLSIEELRFPDKLNVVYDIQTTDFSVPTLTLQPMVENAVRYGISKKKHGGTLTISAHETDVAFTVTVEDDGAGFNPEVIPDDGRAHVGISNVRDRIARMSGGTLEIHSTPDVGTVAVITIPKETRI